MMKRDNKLFEQVAQVLVGKPVSVKFAKPSGDTTGEALVSADGKTVVLTILPLSDDASLLKLFLRGCATAKLFEPSELKAYKTSYLATRMLDISPVLKQHKREDELASTWLRYALRYEVKQAGVSKLERELRALLVPPELSARAERIAEQAVKKHLGL